MTFDTRSSWGAPQTLSLRLSSVDLGEDGNEKLAHADESGTLHYSSEVGFCWVDLRPLWARIDPSKSVFATVMCHAQICSLDSIQSFDDHGDFCASVDTNPEVSFFLKFAVQTTSASSYRFLPLRLSLAV